MKVHVKEYNEVISSDTCYLSSELYSELGLENEEMYTVHVGQVSVKLFVEPYECGSQSMYFSQVTLCSLLLYERLFLNIWKQDKDIYLGPVIGILVCMDHYWCVKGKEPPASAIQYIKSGIAEGCLCYYFTLKDLDWSQHRIKGYSYIIPSGKWASRWFPVADVVYDRHGNFPNKEKKVLLDETREKLRSYPNLHLINSRNSLGGKWQECSRLSKHAEIKDYIPETILYHDFNDVLHMLDKHKFIFLKSVFGSLGRSVLSLELEQGQYKIHVYDKGLKELQFTDICEVEKIVSEFKGSRRFIIQQGIRLLQYEGRHLDLRVLMQKDGSGLWNAVIHFTRVARGTSTITNQSSGGEFVLYDHLYPFLHSPFCTGGIPDSRRISEAAVKLSDYIDREFAPMGELGLDLGIDVFGKIWFIEVNEKPAKDWNLALMDLFQRNWIEIMFEVNQLSGDYLKIEPDHIDGVLPQASNILKYAKFLAVK